MTPLSGAQVFNYSEAFDRNLGWLTSEDQERLRNSCVAIAGMGGAGGFQAQALARLGLGRFKIADADTFELNNFNRQIGATWENIGKRKVDVLQEMILSINPEAKVEIFSSEISAKNIDAFLDSTNLAIDGIDFLAQDAKWLFFRKCREKQIPALTCCPLGFGASLLVFSPNGMRYEDYFDLCENMSEEEKRFHATFGLSPEPFCLSYMDRKLFNPGGSRMASVSPGLMLVGALTASKAVQILAGKGKVGYAPHIYQIDLLTEQVSRRFYPWGMKGPWLRVKKWLLFQVMKLKEKANSK